MVPEIEGATYLGCFEDVRMERTMTFAYVNNDDLTNEVSVGRGIDPLGSYSYPSLD